MSNNNFDINKGDTVNKILTVTSGDGQPYDLTGTTVKFAMKVSAGSASQGVALEKELTILDPPTDGKAKLILLPSETTDLALAIYAYDIRLKKDADNIYTVVEGEIHVKEALAQFYYPLP